MKEIEDVPYIGIKLQNRDEVKRSGGDSISMKSYLGLTAAYEKVHRKTGRITERQPARESAGWLLLYDK